MRAQERRPAAAGLRFALWHRRQVAPPDRIRQTARMPDSLSRALNDLDEQAFQALYGRWDPLKPPEVAALLAASGVRWYIAGGRAARLGAPPRHHGDTDVVIRYEDVAALRDALAGDWHLWEAHDGALRPLLPGCELTPDREQLWARRDAGQPWQLDLPLDRRSTDSEWVFKRDAGIRLSWDQALQVADGISYLRPEIALLHKARLDRPKDRADLAAAVLEPEARDWLATMLHRLGHAEWAELARGGGVRPVRYGPNHDR